MISRVLFLSIFIFFIFSRISFSSDTEKITIANFRYYNVPKDLVVKIQDIITEYLYTKNQNFEFRDSNFVTKKFSDKNREFKNSEILDIGAKTKVDIIIIGNLTKETNYKIILEFLDAKTGQPKYISKRYVEEKKDIQIASISMVNDYAVKYLYPTTTGFVARGVFVPGWAQFYTNQEIKGYTLMTLFTISAAYASYRLYDWKKKRNDYDDYDSSHPEPQYNAIAKDKYDTTEKAFRKLKVAGGLLGFVYLYNWLDMTIATPEFQTNFNVNESQNNISLFKRDNTDIFLDINDGIENNRYFISTKIGLMYRF